MASSNASAVDGTTPGTPQTSGSRQPGNLECGADSTQFCLLARHGFTAYGAVRRSSTRSQEQRPRHRTLTLSAASTLSRSFTSSAPYTLTKFTESGTTALTDCAGHTAEPESRLRAVPDPLRRTRCNKELQAARQRRSTYARRPSDVERKATDRTKHPDSGWVRSSSVSSTEAFSAVESANEHTLARMTTLEQQRWINVQQKTFTKWCVAKHCPISALIGQWLIYSFAG